MHYLGKLKKQTYLFQSVAHDSESIINGQPLFSPDKEQPIGVVIDSAFTSENGNKEQIFLASVSNTAMESGNIYMDKACTIMVEQLDLPSPNDSENHSDK